MSLLWVILCCCEPPTTLAWAFDIQHSFANFTTSFHFRRGHLPGCKDSEPFVRELSHMWFLANMLRVHEIITRLAGPVDALYADQLSGRCALPLEVTVSCCSSTCGHLHATIQTASKKRNRITDHANPEGMGLCTPRSEGGGAAQGFPNQSSGARSTTATPLWGSRT